MPHAMPVYLYVLITPVPRRSSAESRYEKRLYPQMMYVLTTDNTSGSNGSSSATVRKM
jgi:hypothetical protein